MGVFLRADVELQLFEYIKEQELDVCPALLGASLGSALLASLRDNYIIYLSDFLGAGVSF